MEKYPANGNQSKLFLWLGFAAILNVDGGCLFISQLFYPFFTMGICNQSHN
jgi:hypothetical protein